MTKSKLTLYILISISILFLSLFIFYDPIGFNILTVKPAILHADELKPAMLHTDNNHLLPDINASTLCGQNDILCNEITHPLCKYVLGHPLLCQHHHKTGYKLSQKIGLRLSHFCGLSVADNDKVLRGMLMERLSTKPEQLYKTFYKTDLKVAILLHFMRPPVTTILSGFYYHLKAREKWLTNAPISRAKIGHYRVQNIHLYTDLIGSNHSKVDQQDYYKKYWNMSKQVRRCFILPQVSNYLDTFYKNNIIHSQYALREDFTVREFYNTLDISHSNTQMGLFWEFIRYYNCEWPYSYLMDQIGTQFFDHYHRFNLDDFGTNSGFDLNINRFFDAVNIIDNNSNMQRLYKTNSKVNITEARNKLFTSMKKEDLNGITRISRQKTERLKKVQNYRVKRKKPKRRRRMKRNVRKIRPKTPIRRAHNKGFKQFPMKMIRKARHRARYINNETRFKSFKMRHSSHVTKGDYDKKESIKLLLTIDKQICALLKNMTILLSFDWKYSEFC